MHTKTSVRVLSLAILLMASLFLLFRPSQWKEKDPFSDNSDGQLSQATSKAKARERKTRLFDPGDSKVREFLNEDRSDSSRVLAVSYLLRDPSFLELFKEMYKNDTEFALHYASAFPGTEDAKEMIARAIERNPSNPLLTYVLVGIQAKNSASENELVGLLRDAVNQTDYEDYSESISAMAQRFLEKYMEVEPFESARITHSEYSFAPNLIMANSISKLLESDGVGGVDEDLLAGVFNFGTNLSGTGDPIGMTIGVSLEKIVFSRLSEGDLPFNIPIDEVESQLVNDRKLVAEIVSTNGYIDAISKNNYEEYLKVRSESGKLAAILFLREQAKAKLDASRIGI